MASVLADNSGLGLLQHRTLYGTSPQRRKVEQGNTAALQAPVEKYAHEVRSGSRVRNDLLPLLFDQGVLRTSDNVSSTVRRSNENHCREMTFVFTVCGIQHEADAELWLVFGKKRRHRMV